MDSPKNPPPFKGRAPSTFFQSVLYAWDGLIHTAVHQRNMRMHLVAAIMVGLVGSGIPLGLAEKVTMIFCVLLVLFAEVLNSALEHLVDLATDTVHENARHAKDAAAAGVLVLALGSTVIFALILVHNAEAIASNGALVQRQVLVGAPITFLGGALMHEQKKPLWLDGAMFFAAICLLGYTLTWSQSLVLSAMTFGMLVVCVAAAWKRHHERADGAAQK
ncbi:MAG: diacylglycerol kinase family protein [Archangiaceae bacterium]|nr:diacylglycerol kinase family protein [Archangiaceae bacterium]